MIANAISSFLQPSIYESIIIQKQYPYLVDLPPSRTSVHTLKVEQVMTHDVVCLTRQTTYKELIDILNATPNLRAYPLVSDIDSMILLGSVARKYLNFLLMRKIGGSPVLSKNNEDRKPRGASEMISSILKNSSSNLSPDVLTERHISGSALLANSPLLPSHSDTKLASFIRQQTSSSFAKEVDSITHMERLNRLREPIDLDEVVIDPAPFQLVLGTSLYKVHTLFSLLGLHHAYVTNQGKLVGVVAIRELRNALVDIYSRGAIATNLERKSTIYSVCPVRIDDENDISIAVPRRSVSVIRCDRSDPLLYDNYGESDGPQYPLNENHLNLSNASLHPSVCMVSVRNGTNKDDGESGNVSEEENARLLSEDNLKLRKESDE
ncbi:hypothetical protein AB6A40_001408 [Gnathostoma spinigerum]|uniref:CBS domain-containing protein n=1 Tax=Gnathostoma spinigerum TaxID=75299 RepID=A0ABD6E437_9BILA